MGAEKLIKTLDEASRVELGFPHEFYKRDWFVAWFYGGLRDTIIA